MRRSRIPRPVFQDVFRSYHSFKASLATLAFFVVLGTLLSSTNFAYAAFGGGAPTVLAPDPFGGYSSTLRVDGSTGAFTQSVPISIPPGRNGIQPALSLNYSSQRTEDSMVGYGWSLSIPYIERLNKTGTQDLYSNSTFLSSMDGELVQTTATGMPYKARVDTGSAMTYVYDNNSWVVYDKKGTRYIFGASDSGRLYDTLTASSSAQTFRWMLQEVRDTNDNYATFTYSRDSNEMYPYQITYTGNDSTDGPFLVSFATTTRSDARENYKARFKVTTRYRISQIDVSIDGALVNRYALSYGTGANGYRSLLTGIQQTGYDESSSGTTLPAYTFSYKNDLQLFQSNNGSILNQAYIPGDINGDALLDVTYAWEDSGLHLTNSFAGSIAPPEYWSTGSGSPKSPLERGTRFFDVNGDGKADIVRGFRDDDGAAMTSNLYLNTSSGGSYNWTATTTFSNIPAFGYKTEDGVYTLTTGLFGEVNGDGYLDFVMALDSYTGTYTYVGNGSGWATSTLIFDPVFQMPTPGSESGSGTQLVDVNGDGLDDWMYVDGSQTKVRLNTGSNWESSAHSAWTIATSTYYSSGSNYYDRGMRFMDLNGDGLPDFVRAYKSTSACGGTEVADYKLVLLNTGNGWATSTAYTLPDYITECDGTKLVFDEYANWTGNGQMAQDVIVGATTPKGSTKSIEYTPSAQLGNNPDLPVSLLVVTAIGEYDGFGTAATTTYSYQNGKLYLENKQDRRFAGFGIATTTAPDSITATFYSQGDGASTALGEETDSFAHMNRPFRKDVLSLSGILLERTYFRYDTHTVASSTFIGVGKELTFEYGSSGTHKDRATEYLYATTTQTYDLTRSTEYGEVAGASDGTFSDLGTDKRITDITYTSGTTTATSTGWFGGSGGMAFFGNFGSSFASIQNASEKLVRSTSTLLKSFARATVQPLALLSEDVLSASLPSPQPNSIETSLVGKSSYEKANIKGRAIAEALIFRKGERVAREVYDIEVVSAEPMDGGVAVFIRAWKDGEQIGFGPKGTVEIERFKIFNPPILVQDLNGSITRKYVDPKSAESRTVQYREDPEEAIFQSLEHTLSVMRNVHGPEHIMFGSVGNTVSTFYPAAGANSPVDGYTGRDVGGGESWSTIIAGAGNFSSETITDYAGVTIAANGSSDKWETVAEGHYMFDTSSIPETDTISSATLSLYGSTKQDPGSNAPNINVYQSTASATNDIANADFQNKGSTAFSTSISYSSFTTSGYNNFSLNGSGIANINTSGISKFASRNPNYVVTGSPPTWGSAQIMRLQVYHVDQSGAANDPKLVVEHTAEAVGGEVSVPISLPSTETLTNYSGTKIKETKLYYDNLALGSADKGNLTRRDTWISGSTYRSDQMAYTAYGMLASSTDPRGNITTNTYDAKNLYVATSTNPLSQATQFYYDYTLGKPKTTIDPNTRVFQTTYDGLDRPLTEQQPDLANPSNLTTKKDYSYTDTIGSRKVVETNFLDGSTDFTLYTYLDGLDRVIQTRKEAETSNEFSVKDFVYNTAGLLQQESLPYFSSGSSKTSATSISALFTTYTYDGLKRVLTATNALGVTTSTYDVWSATTTDANGNSKGLMYDSFKRLARVIEYNDSASYVTQYDYDTLGNLTKITDANSNIRNFTYDGLGRRLTAQDLHDSADGTFGTWTYVYDDAGNLASTTDPKSQLVNYTYDNINRVLTEDFTGLAGTEVQYGYDSCAEGVGRLCTATSGAATTFTYNALGLPASEQKTINNTLFTTSYSYNRQGSPTNIVYPDSSEVQYTYNTAGLLETVAQKESGGSFSNLLSDFDYAPTEKVTYKLFGNGVQSTYTYNPDALYRLTNILTASSTGECGGCFGFGGTGSPWSNLARAIEELPLALKLAIDLPEDFAEIEQETPVIEETLPEEEEAAVEDTSTLPEEEVSTSTPVIEEPLEEIVKEAATLTPELPTESVIDTESATSTPEETATSTEPILTTPALSIETATTSDATLVEATSTATSLEKELEGKEIQEQATIKGQRIAERTALRKNERIARERYDIEIVDVEPIEGGVQVFARAWRKDGTQIGFGADGTVDVERFRIFNPPILVQDSNGPIVREYIDPKTEEKKTITYREDVQEALFQSLEHILSVKQEKFSNERIVSGKIGNTTSTFYPVAGANSPVDGYAGIDRTGSCVSWSTLIGLSGNYSSETLTDYAGINFGTCGSGGNWEFTAEGHYMFNTAPIGGDGISSATLSLYGATKMDPDSNAPNINIYQSTAAAQNDIANGDFPESATTEFSTSISYASFTTSGYNNFPLNASGIANINPAGVSQFASRNPNYVVSGVSPTHGGDSHITRMQVYFADQGGSTNDPVLVVEHFNSDFESSALQDISFTYDAVGNITHISDLSGTAAAKLINYTYDDLYRLTVASTTAATSTAFRHEYTYDALGNMTGWRVGAAATSTYTYNDDGYNNPHAADSVGGADLTYDNNGNLVSYLSSTYGWDYRNRLASTSVSGNVTTFGYDNGMNRVWKYNSSVGTTTYASRYFVVASSTTGTATTTKNIYTPDGELIAYIETVGATSTRQYVHNDHLGSVSATTDSNGDTTSVRDYLPFGSERINETYGIQASRKSYISRERDSTGELYLTNRYYNSDRGQFLSQDPYFWSKLNLSDPQSQNSYSYANNNPIRMKDPDGLAAKPGPNVEAIIQAEIKKSQDAFINRVQNMTEPARQAYLQAIGYYNQYASGVQQGLANPGQGLGGSFLNRIGQITGTLGFGVSMLPITPGGVARDLTLVCRGGACKASTFIRGAESVSADGILQGVSVFGRSGLKAEELGQLVPHSTYGVSSVEAVRALGGTIEQQGNNLNHYLINGLTPKQLESLFTPVINNLYR